MVPEPLSKVLEPSVSVTYLDQSSDPDDFLRSSKHLEPVIKEDDEEEEKTTGPVEVKPAGTGSDGPVIYKLSSGKPNWTERLLTKSFLVMSPIRDPVETRNRFEGLVEGAIEMYMEDGTETPEIASSAALYAARCRENRGKSAIPFRYSTSNTKFHV